MLGKSGKKRECEPKKGGWHSRFLAVTHDLKLDYNRPGSESAKVPHIYTPLAPAGMINLASSRREMGTMSSL